MWECSKEFEKAFPSYLKEDIFGIENNTSVPSSNYGIRGGCFTVLVNNEVIQIPERHHLQKIQNVHIFDRLSAKDAGLSDKQRAIIDCFYSRHCDGYVRENHCKKIIQYSLNHEWVVPYILRLTGEYVVEILDIIASNLDKINNPLFNTFIKNNKEFYELIRQRVQSYWNCYYRTAYPKKNEYPGFKIMDFFDKNL